jgi:hypothetical protein
MRSGNGVAFEHLGAARNWKAREFDNDQVGEHASQDNFSHTLSEDLDASFEEMRGSPHHGKLSDSSSIGKSKYFRLVACQDSFVIPV